MSPSRPPITRDHVASVLRNTADVIEHFPARLVGTPDAVEASKHLERLLQDSCDPETIRREAFQCAQGALLKWFWITPVAYFMALAMLLEKYFSIITMVLGLSQPIFPDPWVPSLVAFTTLFAVVLVFLFQFVFYKELLDPLFTKVTGYNVSGTLEPSGDARQHVILQAHHDAAFVCRFMEWSMKCYPVLLFIPIASTLLLTVATGLGLVLSLAWPALFSMPAVVVAGQVATIAFAATSPFVVLIAFYSKDDEISPGAGDALVGTLIAHEVIRYFKEHGRPAHTRVSVLSVDAEEAGLRGARAWVKAHETELHAIPTFVLGYDCVFRADNLAVFQADLNGTVPLSREMAAGIVEIATARGYKASLDGMRFGGGATDLAEFGKRGIEGTVILAFDTHDLTKTHELGVSYHTLKDDVAMIEPAAVEQLLNITVDYITQKDAAAL